MEIPPFSTIKVHGITKVKGHGKKVNLIVKSITNRPNPWAVVVPINTDLKPDSSKVNMNLRKLASRRITVKAKSIVAQVTTGNVVTPILSQKILRNQKNG